VTPPGAVAIEGCHVATVDAAGSEHPSGHVVIEDGRIAAAGPGRAPGEFGQSARIDGAGLLVTPGLVNTHSHLYQWLTRGYATEDTLFGWLTTLYPIWARLTPELVHTAAAANLAWLALTGCTTSTDHHYVFPAGAGDLLEAEILAAQQIGVRFHPARGSMNLGQSAGGLPPDSVVEEHDVALAATEAAIDRWHDASFDAMTRIAVAPCSPFSVTGELMRDSAQLARTKGVRLHTHLAETQDEEQFCLETFGRTPAEYAEDLGLAGPRRVDGALRSSFRRGGGPVRRHRDRRGALPHLQRPPGLGHRADPQAARRARRGRARRRRERVQRVWPHDRRTASGPARGSITCRAPASKTRCLPWSSARPRLSTSSSADARSSRTVSCEPPTPRSSPPPRPRRAPS
jgi:Amidohydrolase family